MSQKLAIIGMRNFRSALQKGAEKAGYERRTTGADPNDVRTVGTWGVAIILAIPVSARRDAIENLGDVNVKTLVEVTNLLNDDWSYAGDLEKSGAEQVQEWAPSARIGPRNIEFGKRSTPTATSIRVVAARAATPLTSQ